MAKTLAGSSLLLSASGAHGFVQQPPVRALNADSAVPRENLESGSAAPSQQDVSTSQVAGAPATAAQSIGSGCAALVAAGLAWRRRGSAEARAPSVVRCAYDASKELGACSPLGYWDPFGLMAFEDKAKFDRNRELELKHGRVCMVAIIGITFPDLFGKFEGYLSPSLGLKFADIPSSIQAIYKVPLEGWLQILAFAGLLEARNIFFPMNYGYPPFLGQIGKLSPEEKEKKLLAELNNGRLAMIAMAATVAQNGATGQTLIEQFTQANLNPWIGGYANAEDQSRTALRAYDASKELGACSPLGYWDPFGLMAFQDKAKFDRNRELELKHGRVCMVAIIGITFPDLFGKFEGYLSPSLGLKFADIPSSIQAIYKVPLEGWLQILAFAGLLEARNIFFPMNYGYPPFLGQIGKLSPEEKEKKLLAELNNGRLAMIAMAATVAQNGATGQTLIEQFTQANLNPWIGGYAGLEEQSRTRLRAVKRTSEALP